jgi:hypothetical protein
LPWRSDDCKPLISYSGTNISFSGFEGPSVVNFDIASFNIKREIVQAASDIAQIYDLFRYSNCQKMQQFPKDSPERVMFILEAQKNELRLLEFLSMLRIASSRPSEAIEQALADWVALSYSKKIREEAPIIPEKVRSGEQARESPPIDKLNKIAISVTKARISSDYMRDALAKPDFDINRVYKLTMDKEQT